MALSSLKATTGGDFEAAPAGTHRAVLVRMIDIGTQVGEYLGQPTKRRQIVFSWEIDELMKDDRPFMVSKFYTMSLAEKAALRRDLESWRGKAFSDMEGFDLTTVLGKSCLIGVAHNANGKAKVQTVSKLPKGMEPLQPVGEVMLFDLDNPNWAVYENLSEWMQTTIAASPEYKAIGTPQSSTPANPPSQEPDPDKPFDDDLPF